jgi:CheY-like chemotaxis protein
MVPGRKFHVLVVDSAEDMVTTTTAMLEQLGYTAEGVVGSLAGLRTFSQDPDRFDIAIVDPGISENEGREVGILGSMRRGSPVTPELTAVELAVRFRRIRQDFPVIPFTGHNKPVLAKEIQAAGFTQAISTQAGLRELDEAVRKGLHSCFPNVR